MTFVLGVVRCFAEQAHAPFRVIAYVYGNVDFAKISAHKLTHINYAFATLSPEGELMLEPRATTDLAALNKLKAANPRLKILLSVGGWGADHFSDAALTGESRARMATSAVDVIREHKLDGVDLDWEYPGQAGPGIKHRPEDKQNFTLLLAEFRKQLDAYDDQRNTAADDRSLLTIASASGVYFKHTEMDKLHESLDFINVMSYDLYNSVAKTTGHHTGLFRSDSYPEDAHAYWAAQGIEQHLAAGIPPEMIVIGAAFYGRAWAGVNPAGKGIGQSYEKYAGEHAYSELLTDFIDKNGYERRWDASAQAPYLWNSATKTLVSYDDPESLAAKVRYAREKKLGGVMFWQYGNDPGEHLLDAIVKAAAEK